MPDQVVRTDTFTLVYEGGTLEQGEMDVYDLAPALLAVGETFKAANASLNGSSTEVTTSVKADFREGSFEILFAVQQQLADAAGGIIPALHLLGANALIETVIGNATDAVIDKAKEKVVSGLFKLIGILHGREPKEVGYDETRKVNVMVFGNNNSILVEENTAALYRDPRVRSSAAKVANPLKKSGIKSLRAKKGTTVLASVVREDFPELVDSGDAPIILSPAPDPETTQTLIVRILKPDFVGDKWSVSDGGKPYTVSMADENFKAKVHAREIGFYDGDMYRVRMETSSASMAEGSARRGKS